MIRGTLIVEGDPAAVAPAAPAASSASPEAWPAAGGEEDAEVAARRAEVRRPAAG